MQVDRFCQILVLVVSISQTAALPAEENSRHWNFDDDEIAATSLG